MRRLAKRERFATQNNPGTIYLERAVLASLFATGNGRQTQVNDAVKDWLHTDSPV